MVKFNITQIDGILYQILLQIELFSSEETAQTNLILLMMVRLLVILQVLHHMQHLRVLRIKLIVGHSEILEVTAL